MKKSINNTSTHDEFKLVDQDNNNELLWSFEYLYKDSNNQFQKSDLVKTIKTILSLTLSDIGNNIKKEFNEKLNKKILFFL